MPVELYASTAALAFVRQALRFDSAVADIEGEAKPCHEIHTASFKQTGTATMITEQTVYGVWYQITHQLSDQ